jgi:hypothetical protein
MQPEVATEQIADGTDQAIKPNDDAANEEPAPQDAPNSNSAAMTPNMGGFPMGWNGNGMNPYMAGMFNFPNTMGESRSGRSRFLTTLANTSRNAHGDGPNGKSGDVR